MKSLKKFIKEQQYDWDTLEKKIGDIAEKIKKYLKKEGFEFLVDDDNESVILACGDDEICMSDRFHANYLFSAKLADWDNDGKKKKKFQKACAELNKYLKQLAKIEDEDGESFFIGVEPDDMEPAIMNDNDFFISLVD